MNEGRLEICVDQEVLLMLTEKVSDGVMEILVSGELRNETAHDFEDEIMAAFSVCKTVRLDLSGVTYLASLAMRTLLSIQQIIDENQEAQLVISRISLAVKEIFTESGFMEILNIEEA